MQEHIKNQSFNNGNHRKRLSEGQNEQENRFDRVN